MRNLSYSMFEVVDPWRNPKGWRLWFAILGLAMLLAAAAVVTYLTGGTRTPYLHVAYIPIALAGALFGSLGGILAGLVAGLLIGPIMPLDAAAHLPQTTSAWIYRLVFFTLIGGFIGQLSHVLNLRLNQLQTSNERLSSAYAQTLKAFTSLVAYRDEQTAGHCDRVAHNAKVVGKALGVSRGDLDNLYWAGILHDLGKVATPTDVLLKPGPLTDAESQEIEKHSIIGADLLYGVSKEFAPIAEAVRSHHERWDGRGYPDSLKEEEIPLFGRILAVVDVFEALTSDRPYRPALRTAEAVRYIKDEAGHHFDPEISRVFVHAYEDGRIYMSAQVDQPGEYWPLPKLQGLTSIAKPN